MENRPDVENTIFDVEKMFDSLEVFAAKHGREAWDAHLMPRVTAKSELTYYIHDDAEQLLCDYYTNTKSCGKREVIADQKRYRKIELAFKAMRLISSEDGNPEMHTSYAVSLKSGEPVNTSEIPIHLKEEVESHQQELFAERISQTNLAADSSENYKNDSDELDDTMVFLQQTHLFELNPVSQEINYNLSYEYTVANFHIDATFHAAELANTPEAFLATDSPHLDQPAVEEVAPKQELAQSSVLTYESTDGDRSQAISTEQPKYIHAKQVMAIIALIDCDDVADGSIQKIIEDLIV